MIPRLQAALAKARDTKRLEIGRGTLARVPAVLREQFSDRSAVLIGDANTFAATAGKLAPPGRCERFTFGADVYAEWKCVEQLEAALRKAAQDAIPIAVGSGTINDLTKLVAHRLGRPYLCVATAASMDGYTAYGASITKDGSKQTFDCPAPRGVVADIDVIEAAPRDMTASGYADLLAKITAGADWILADALGVEPVDPIAWETVQTGLREALAHPIDIEKLTEGLLMGGFAMQAAQSSRPASGAEHQFSHLWDMQHATDASHGFKVGVATLAVTRLYEWLLEQPIETLNIKSAVTRWPAAWDAIERNIRMRFPDDEQLQTTAIRESKAKYVNAAQLEPQLNRLRKVWPELKARLRAQLLPATTMEKMLADAGAPTTSEQIGISQEALRDSFKLAYYIRRRFTVLDLAVRAGLFESSMDKIFGNL